MKRHTSLGVEEGFFNTPRDSSIVKCQIVTEYFDYYMKVMARNGKLAGYIDLFAGPGKFGTGRDSIPMIIARQVAEDDRLRRSVKLWFNEGDPENFKQLKVNIEAISGISSLAHPPRITDRVISTRLAQTLASIRTPSFIFADPCGYKGLSLKLIAAALKPFGNDCIFFFNYNRVNMKLSYEIMNDSIDEFFEPNRADRLRKAIQEVRSSAERESVILDAVRDALKKAGAYPLTFGFRTREGGGTSHHLVYATKNLKALNSMKRIFTKASSDVRDGVGSLDYNPHDASMNPMLFSPLEEVRDRLLNAFARQSLTFDELVLAEGPRTAFTETAYRNALLELEEERRVTMEPGADERRFQPGGERRTLPGATRITFP